MVRATVEQSRAETRPGRVRQRGSPGGGHYACGVVSGALALLAVALVYTTLLASVAGLSVLSTTAVAFTVVLAWIGLWFALDATRRTLWTDDPDT